MRLSTFFIHLLMVGYIVVQPKPVLAQPFNFTVYRENDGLPSGYIQSVFEDSRGYLWICTFGGLSRFDGRTFKNYDIKDGLPGNFCDEMCEDKLGNLWIATRRGLCYFDGKNMTPFYSTDSLATYYFRNLKVDAQNRVTCCLNDRNAEVRDNRIHFIDPVFKGTGLPPDPCIIHAFADCTIILNSHSGLYAIYPNKSSKKIEPSVNQKSYLHFDASEKKAFYFADEEGVFHWQNGVVKSLANLSFKNEIVTALFVDDKKRVWVSVEGKGIWIINGAQITFIDRSELPGYLIPSFYQDKRGTMWVCTFRGLVKLTDKFTTHFTEKTGLDNEDIRSSTTLADGSICMQTTLIKNGTAQLLPGNLSKLLNHDQFNDYVDGIKLTRDNTWWIFSRHRHFYEWKNNVLKDLPELYGNVYSRDNAYVKETNTLWYGKENFLCQLRDGKIISCVNTLADHTPLNFIAAVAKDCYGNIWVSEKYRLLLLTGQGLIDFTPKLELSKRIFASVGCSNANGIWIKTQGLGAVHFIFKNNQWIKDKTINTSNGLPNNYIHDIKVDDEQNIWIATLNGLYRFTESKALPNTYNIRNFGVSEGIDIPNWNLAYLEKDSLQNMWLGVANGIFKINTRQIKQSLLPPSVIIEEVNVLNDVNATISSTNGFEAKDNKTELASGQNDIDFRFDGINLNNNFIRYSFMLKGRDKTWLRDQKNNEAIYYNLSPGDYTFMVKAVNDAGLESKLTTYSFTIVPPFWQTWWFRTIVALLAISLIYWFIKNRDEKKEKENLMALQMSELKLTALQSQMNPHFIFNSLNSIQNYILQQKPIDAARYLSKFSRLMRRILDHSFNNLTPLNEIVETLKMYMELEAFRFSNEFTWEVKVENEESINDVKLPPLLLQPYVENAIIHGLMPKQGEKRLMIRLYKSSSNELHCVIDDNGVGRGNKLGDKEGHISRGQKLTTDMLATMKQLLHTDAQIKITDKTNDTGEPIGTTVDLIIPMTT